MFLVIIIANNKIGDEGAKAIGISNLKNLTRLELSIVFSYKYRE
jgi:hypothetical protein